MGWRVLSLLLMVLLFILAFGLSLANTEMTTLSFYGMGDTPLLRLPLVVLLLGFFLAGVAAGMLARVPAHWRQRRRIRQLERRLREVQNAQIPEIAFPATRARHPGEVGGAPRLRA